MNVFEIAPASLKSMWVLAVIVVVLIGLIALMAYMVHAGRSATFTIADGALTIRGGMYGRTIPLDEIDRDGAEIVSIEKGSPLAPTLRTNGVGLPGLQLGKFRLRNGAKALVYLTRRDRVVHIPLRNGTALLLTPADPAAFLTALRSS